MQSSVYLDQKPHLSYLLPKSLPPLKLTIPLLVYCNLTIYLQFCVSFVMTIPWWIFSFPLLPYPVNAIILIILWWEQLGAFVWHIPHLELTNIVDPPSFRSLVVWILPIRDVCNLPTSTYFMLKVENQEIY